MVRNYKRKSNKGCYDKDQLREAVLAVQNGCLSGYKASQLYNIPRMTIMDHVHKKRSTNIIGRKTCLSAKVETDLATCLHTMEKNGFGLTRKEILEMVGVYVNRNNISASFKNGIPGKDWFVSFAKRHNLSIKKPQAVEYARKTAIDPFVVYPYFDLLEKTISELGLQDKPHAIWNLDETSFSKDPSKTKIVGVKGYAATRVIATPGKDNTTVLLGASAAGQKASPLIIFKGKNVWDEWTSPDAYPGTTYAATKNGWMETAIFETFFKKSFLPMVGDNRPVLLIYDGHSTHVGLNLIEQARKANVTIIKLPAHTSHVLQPLDVAVMKSFKDQWDLKLVQWQRLNVGIPLPKKDFSKLIGSIWTQINPQVLRNGFRKAGIYPVSPNVIHHRMFDSLQLERWHESAISPLTQQKYKPKTLFDITLNTLNKNLGTQCANNQKIIFIDKNMHHSNNKDLDETLVVDKNISFEVLLLQKLKRGDNSSKIKRRKVAPGAEVITHDDVITFKRDEQNRKKQKIEKSQANPSSKHKADVVLLSDISKNSSQLKPFTAKNSKELPQCLQKSIPNTRKIKVLSDITIVKPSENLEMEPGPSRIDAKNLHMDTKPKIGPINIKNAKKVNPTLLKIINKTPKGKGFGKENRNEDQFGDNFFKLKQYKNYGTPLSSSTTSVSGSYCSDHSDSDIANISSDFNNNDDEDSDIIKPSCSFKSVTTKINKREPNILRFNLRNKKKDHDSTVNERNMSKEKIYCINDHVIVRYYCRNNWTYYVGIIEDVSIPNVEYYYKIRFYKTLKKPRLLFKMTKKIDRDEVPEISIVKKVDLSNNTDIFNTFVLSCEDDEIYFNKNV